MIFEKGEKALLYGILLISLQVSIPSFNPTFQIYRKLKYIELLAVYIQRL